MGWEEQVTRTVWGHLRHSGSWDQLVFNDVLGDSLVMAVLSRLMADDYLSISSEEVGIRYCVDLPLAWDIYLAKLETGVAKRFSYKRRKLERAGRVSERTVSTPEELEAAFDELVRLHTARWRSREKHGVFASPRFAAYHKQLALSLLRRDMLRMRLLSLDDVNVAVLYNFRFRGTEYFYQGGFDVDRAAKYSPGLLAHVEAIRDSIECRLARYDFMKGGTASYKAEYGCTEHPMHDVRVFARTFLGQFLRGERWGRTRLASFKRGSRGRDGSAAADTE
jgi:CelD/BcsL family acetyltransferase involved in cellulose biosynthesis